ncbi:MAG: DUF4249 domain-containing protein [Cyclobacteriaceae bacterium]|nr:DUF4249 domain-containing protein [Cyclobacteriaceae bacterium]
MRIIYFCLFFLTFACETVVDIVVPLEEPRVVVNGSFNEIGQWKFFVSKSSHILDDANPPIYDSAIVKIFEGESELATLPYDGVGLYSVDSILPVGGVTYRVEVTVPDIGTAYATSVLPSKPMITSVIYDSLVFATAPNINPKNAIYIKFKDNGEERNYYILNLKEESVQRGGRVYDSDGTYVTLEADTAWRYQYFSTEDPLISAGEGFNNARLIFSDEFFDGKEYEARIDVPAYGTVFRYRVIMHSITEDAYLYYQSLVKQREALHDPFAEPANVYGNVEGGYGIFYGVAADSVDIVL